jgi:hypothetical protein
VNLTCGRNPWKQASFEDSTYRAYARNQGFLKTILPVSDQLNDILGMVFNRDPDQRITLPELRERILACPRFTEQPATTLPSPPASPDHITYVNNYDESAIEDDFDYDAPLSPASSDSMSDGESTCSSDEGSLSSSGSSLEDFDDDDDLIEDIPEVKTPPPQTTREEPTIYEAEDVSMGYRTEYMHPYVPVMAEPMPPLHMPMHTPKYHGQPFSWDRITYHNPPAPQLHHPVPFHYQVPMFTQMQGCY